MCTVAPHNRTLAFPQDGTTREFLVSIVAMRDKSRAMGAAILMKDLDSIKTVQSLVSYSAKLAALGRLTSGVAHEVKNPLNAMMIHLELLRQQVGGSRQGQSAAGSGAAGGRAAVAVADAPASQALEHVDVIANEIRRLDSGVQGFLK